jgi:hypothetical protein
VGALTTDGQALAVPDALEAPDLDLALDVLLHVAAEVTLDAQVLVDVGPDAGDLVLGQPGHLGVRVEPEIGAELLRGRATDAEDVGERDLQPLLAGDVDAGDACHRMPLSALSLLVAGVLADHHDAPVPADDLALLAHLLDAGAHLHDDSLAAITCIGR